MADITKGKWEPLGSGARVWVTEEHRFNTDTILLADFSAPKHKEICADFGTGCGTIPLLWAIRNNPKKIIALELQERACLQAGKSIAACNLDIQLINDNINNYRQLFAPQSLDVIACNPPYKAKGRGLKNSDGDKMVARHEEELTMTQLAQAAAYSLRFGGRLCICQRPERLSDAMNIFSRHGLEPKILRLVQGHINKPPSLFLLECRRGGNMGLKVLPTLIIHENGGFTPEMIAIYGDYKDKNTVVKDSIQNNEERD